MIYFKSILIFLMNKKIFNKIKYFIFFFLNNFFLDLVNSLVIINGCVMVVKLGVVVVWVVLMMFIMEMYLMVVR